MRSRAALVLTLVLSFSTAVRAQLPLPRAFRIAHPLPTSRLPLRPLGTGVLPDAETLDHALAATRLDVARARFRADGTGATVCIVDTGADVTHPLLRDDAGRTRLRYLVDLDAAARPDETDADARALAAVTRTAVWSATSLDAASTSAVPGDPWGHGTAVASLVARAAPGAALVVVKALRAGSGGFHDEDLMRAVDVCVRAADPSREVLLFALGGHDGAHDGTEPLEEALAAAPALVVAAAGNDAPDGAAPHARFTLTDDDVAVQIHVPSPGPFALGPSDDGERSVTIVAVTGADSDAELALEAPDGTRTEWTAIGATQVRDAATARLAVEAASAPRANGAHVVYAVITGGGSDLPALRGGRYALHARGTGVLDAWIADSELASPLSSPGFVGEHADHEDTVTIPATSSGVVAVGALVTATAISELSLDGAWSGMPADFSARGPRRDGVAKPDLLAPGAYDVGALARDVTGMDPHDLTGGSPAVLAATRVGDRQVALLGTSFAAPFVAATLALAMGDGGSGPSRGAADRALLAATARPLSAAPWDSRAGFGILDAERFLALRVAATGGSPLDPTTLRATFTRDTGLSGETVGLVVLASHVDGTPVARGSIFVDGVAAGELVGGLASLVVTVPALPGATWLAHVAVRDAADASGETTAALRLRARAAPSITGGGGGGCSVSSTSASAHATTWAVLVLVLVLVLSAARSRSRSSRRGPRPGTLAASRA